MAVAYWSSYQEGMVPHIQGGWVKRTDHEQEIRDLNYDLRELKAAAKEALELLESLGYVGGDIHDNLAALVK